MKFSGNLYIFGFIMGIVKTGRLYAKKNLLKVSRWQSQLNLSPSSAA
jgi:hypothetical protein